MYVMKFSTVFLNLMTAHQYDEWHFKWHRIYDLSDSKVLIRNGVEQHVRYEV